MTERIYYDDAYAVSFEAKPLELRREKGRCLVRLNRTAFYPTSGGQPNDTGILGGAVVTDVFADDEGEVWHAIDGALSDDQVVTGQIDWARRFDHMQQHAGEHMLAGAMFRRTGGHTIGLHLGAEVSTIDVEMPGGKMRVEPALLNEIEDEVNALIQSDIPIRCWFPSPDELDRLALRKAPAVEDHIRVVEIGEERVACGGTHPSSSGQIGLLKIVDARPSRGKMRVSFVCGMRAVLDYRAHFNAAREAAALFSTGAPDLKEAVARTLRRVSELEAETSGLRRDAALQRVDALIKDAPLLNDGFRLVKAHWAQTDARAMREAASNILSKEKAYVLFCSDQAQGYLLLFARSEGSEINMGELLARAAREHGGKGGGRPDFAEGSAASADALDTAWVYFTKFA